MTSTKREQTLSNMGSNGCVASRTGELSKTQFFKLLGEIRRSPFGNLSFNCQPSGGQIDNLGGTGREECARLGDRLTFACRFLGLHGENFCDCETGHAISKEASEVPRRFEGISEETLLGMLIVGAIENILNSKNRQKKLQNKKNKATPVLVAQGGNTEEAWKKRSIEVIKENLDEKPWKDLRVWSSLRLLIKRLWQVRTSCTSPGVMHTEKERQDISQKGWSLGVCGENEGLEVLSPAKLSELLAVCLTILPEDGIYQGRSGRKRGRGSEKNSQVEDERGQGFCEVRVAHSRLDTPASNLGDEAIRTVSSLFLWTPQKFDDRTFRPESGNVPDAQVAPGSLVNGKQVSFSLCLPQWESWVSYCSVVVEREARRIGELMLPGMTMFVDSMHKGKATGCNRNRHRAVIDSIDIALQLVHICLSLQKKQTNAKKTFTSMLGKLLFPLLALKRDVDRVSRLVAQQVPCSPFDSSQRLNIGTTVRLEIKVLRQLCQSFALAADLLIERTLFCEEHTDAYVDSLQSPHVYQANIVADKSKGQQAAYTAAENTKMGESLARQSMEEIEGKGQSKAVRAESEGGSKRKRGRKMKNLTETSWDSHSQRSYQQNFVPLLRTTIQSLIEGTQTSSSKARQALDVAHSLPTFTTLFVKSYRSQTADDGGGVSKEEEPEKPQKDILRLNKRRKSRFKGGTVEFWFWIECCDLLLSLAESLMKHLPKACCLTGTGSLFFIGKTRTIAELDTWVDDTTMTDVEEKNRHPTPHWGVLEKVGDLLNVLLNQLTADSIYVSMADSLGQCQLQALQLVRENIYKYSRALVSTHTAQGGDCRNRTVEGAIGSLELLLISDHRLFETESDCAALLSLLWELVAIEEHPEKEVADQDVTMKFSKTPGERVGSVLVLDGQVESEGEIFRAAQSLLRRLIELFSDLRRMDIFMKGLFTSVKAAANDGQLGLKFDAGQVAQLILTSDLQPAVCSAFASAPEGQIWTLWDVFTDVLASFDLDKLSRKQLSSPFFKEDARTLSQSDMVLSMFRLFLNHFRLPLPHLGHSAKMVKKFQQKVGQAINSILLPCMQSLTGVAEIRRTTTDKSVSSNPSNELETGTGNDDLASFEQFCASSVTVDDIRKPLNLLCRLAVFSQVLRLRDLLSSVALRTLQHALPSSLAPLTLEAFYAEHIGQTLNRPPMNGDRQMTSEDKKSLEGTLAVDAFSWASSFSTWLSAADKALKDFAMAECAPPLHQQKQVGEVGPGKVIAVESEKKMKHKKKECMDGSAGATALCPQSGRTETNRRLRELMKAICELIHSLQLAGVQELKETCVTLTHSRLDAEVFRQACLNDARSQTGLSEGFACVADGKYAAFIERFKRAAAWSSFLVQTAHLASSSIASLIGTIATPPRRIEILPRRVKACVDVKGAQRGGPAPYADDSIMTDEGAGSRASSILLRSEPGSPSPSSLWANISENLHIIAPFFSANSARTLWLNLFEHAIAAFAPDARAQARALSNSHSKDLGYTLLSESSSSFQPVRACDSPLLALLTDVAFFDLPGVSEQLFPVVYRILSEQILSLEGSVDGTQTPASKCGKQSKIRSAHTKDQMETPYEDIKPDEAVKELLHYLAECELGPSPRFSQTTLRSEGAVGTEVTTMEEVLSRALAHSYKESHVAPTKIPHRNFTASEKAGLAKVRAVLDLIAAFPTEIWQTYRRSTRVLLLLALLLDMRLSAILRTLDSRAEELRPDLKMREKHQNGKGTGEERKNEALRHVLGTIAACRCLSGSLLQSLLEREETGLGEVEHTPFRMQGEPRGGDDVRPRDVAVALEDELMRSVREPVPAWMLVPSTTWDLFLRSEHRASQVTAAMKPMKGVAARIRNTTLQLFCMVLRHLNGGIELSEDKGGAEGARTAMLRACLQYLKEWKTSYSKSQNDSDLQLAGSMAFEEPFVVKLTCNLMESMIHCRREKLNRYLTAELRRRSSKRKRRTEMPGFSSVSTEARDREFWKVVYEEESGIEEEMRFLGGVAAVLDDFIPSVFGAQRQTGVLTTSDAHVAVEHTENKRHLTETAAAADPRMETNMVFCRPLFLGLELWALLCPHAAGDTECKTTAKAISGPKGRWNAMSAHAVFCRLGQSLDVAFENITNIVDEYNFGVEAETEESNRRQNVTGRKYDDDVTDRREMPSSSRAETKECRKMHTPSLTRTPKSEVILPMTMSLSSLCRACSLLSSGSSNKEIFAIKLMEVIGRLALNLWWQQRQPFEKSQKVSKEQRNLERLVQCCLAAFKELIMNAEREALSEILHCVSRTMCCGGSAADVSTIGALLCLQVVAAVIRAGDQSCVGISFSSLGYLCSSHGLPLLPPLQPTSSSSSRSSDSSEQPLAPQASLISRAVNRLSMSYIDCIVPIICEADFALPRSVITRDQRYRGGIAETKSNRGSQPNPPAQGFFQGSANVVSALGRLAVKQEMTSVGLDVLRCMVARSDVIRLGRPSLSLLLHSLSPVLHFVNEDRRICPEEMACLESVVFGSYSLLLSLVRSYPALLFSTSPYSAFSLAPSFMLCLRSLVLASLHKDWPVDSGLSLAGNAARLLEALRPHGKALRKHLCFFLLDLIHFFLQGGRIGTGARFHRQPGLEQRAQGQELTASPGGIDGAATASSIHSIGQMQLEMPRTSTGWRSRVTELTLRGQHTTYLFTNKAQSRFPRPAVRNAFAPGLYAVLDVLSRHETQLLHSMLNPAGRVMLRDWVNEYERVYKFDGKA